MGKVEELKEKYKPIYWNIGQLFCPALHTHIIFNNHGWIHIRNKGDGKRRNPTNIIMRFNLLSHASEIIQNGILAEKKSYTREYEEKSVEITFFELICEVKNGYRGKECLSVIARKIGENPVHYYSMRRTNNKTKKALENI